MSESNWGFQQQLTESGIMNLFSISIVGIQHIPIDHNLFSIIDMVYILSETDLSLFYNEQREIADEKMKLND